MTKKIALAITFAALLIVSVTGQEISAKESKPSGGLTQQILSVSYDNEVKSSNPDSVNSTGVYATAGHWNPNRIHRYYLFVDLSALPKDAQIQTAELYLDRVSSTWDQDGLYAIHQVQAPWQTTTLTWNNQPVFSTTFVAGIHTQNGLFRFDVTDWLASTSSTEDLQFGFMLKKPVESGDNNGLFATIDYPINGGETRPYLVVTY